MNRYNKEKVSIPHCDVPTSIQAFRRGLVRGSELYRELTKYPCLSFEDVQAKAMAQIRLEEDEEPLKVNPSPDRVERRSNGDYRRDHRSQPYSRYREDRGRTTSGRDRGNAWKEQPTLPPKVQTYNFNVSVAELVKSFDKFGKDVRWPRKSDRPEGKKDMSKWCDFHGDHGHHTDEGIDLRKEVARLLSPSESRSEVH